MATPVVDTGVDAERIDALLPQTQCRQCGYTGCRPYAEAIAAGTAPINRCPPGGEAGLQALAELLDIAAPPALDPTCGTPGPLQLAVIDEAHCIGCTLCIRACPVDAIVGANKHMHTVLADTCTGCGLCVPPCPVDCIEMQSPTPAREWTVVDATRAREHHQRYLARQARRQAQANATPLPSASPTPDDTAAQQRQDMLASLLARARARRTAR